MSLTFFLQCTHSKEKASRSMDRRDSADEEGKADPGNVMPCSAVRVWSCCGVENRPGSMGCLYGLGCSILLVGLTAHEAANLMRFLGLESKSIR
jgi:hypothetical protein